MASKPTIVAYGNCAAQFLAQELRRVPAVTQQFDVHWIRNFTQQAPGDEPLDLTVLGRCAVLLEQVGNFRDDVLRKGGTLNAVPVPSGSRRVRFPPLFMNTLWPFIALDPRNEVLRSASNPEGPYPKYVCNRLILDIMKEERDPDKVYERFTAIRIKDHVDLDRLHQLTMAKIRALDLESDIRVAGYVERNFAAKRLFLMQIHPNGPMLRHLCEGVFEALGLLDAPAVARLGEIEEREGIGGYDAPVHPDIVEHFGLAWARGLTYRHYSAGCFDYDTFIKRYIRFEGATLGRAD